jgi:hypothetical protein
VQLAQQCVDSSSSTAALVVPHSVTASLLNALAQQHPELQPCTAAAELGLVSADGSLAAGADSYSIDSTAPSADTLQASRLIAELCYSQLLQQDSVDVGFLRDAVSVWVDKLSHEAAAAALFSTWYWSQPDAAATQSAGVSAAIKLPVASSLGALGLQLYHAARVGKPSLGSLLLDLALLAAAAAADWDEGGWDVICLLMKTLVLCCFLLCSGVLHCHLCTGWT